MTVVRFPTWLVERRGEVVQGPSAQVLVLPVVRVERGPTKPPKKITKNITRRRKRGAKR